MKKSLLVVFIFWMSSTIQAPAEQANEACIPVNFAFTPGEKIGYSVFYNWGLLWVNAGAVTFNISEKIYGGRPVYHFDAFGTTHRRYDWIFKVRDRFQSYVDRETFRPLWHEMETHEGGYEAHDVYHFIQDENRVIAITENSDRPRQTDTIDIRSCSYDVITAIYVARNLDYSSYGINEPIPFSILIGNGLFDLNPRFLGRERIKTRNGETFNCIKFKVELVEGFIFSKGNEMYVWVTDDENRLPVLVETQIRIGSVKAFLDSYNGLRNPLSARV